MGVELVKAVAATCGRLRGNEYKALVAMACHALDRPNEQGRPARLYFAGWEPLALAMGAAPNRSGYEQVRRALKGLVDAGLVERLQDHPQRGVRQTFRLTLSPNKTLGLDSQQNVGAKSQQNVGAEPLRNVGNSPYETLGPRKEQEPQEDSSQDPILKNVPTSLGRCAGCGHTKFTSSGECLRCGEPRAAA